MLDIRVQAIVLSNDGAPSGPPPAGGTWSTYVEKLIQEANQFYEDQGIGFRLRFDLSTDVAFKKSTLLNQLQPSPLKQDANGNDDDPNGRNRAIVPFHGC